MLTVPHLSHKIASFVEILTVWSMVTGKGAENVDISFEAFCNNLGTIWRGEMGIQFKFGGQGRGLEHFEAGYGKRQSNLVLKQAS